jgi:hypothetical protein
MSSFFGSERGNAGTTGFGGTCGLGDRHSVIHFATLVSGVLRGCNVTSSVCCIASLQSLATSPTILLAESSTRRIGGEYNLLWITDLPTRKLFRTVVCRNVKLVSRLSLSR